MKVGIITFHRAHNYGAVLQCYALYRTLESFGYQVEIIDYYPTYFHNEYAVFSKKRFKALPLKSKFSYVIKSIVCWPIKRKRIGRFNDFIYKLPLSPEQYSENTNYPQGYDCIVFGSDQIWNPQLTDGIDNVFSGGFPKNSTKFIGYAVSTNPKLLVKKYASYFSEIIKRFDAISTRESSLCNYLNTLEANSALQVLDPVLLLDREKWEHLIVRPDINNYLLIYTVPQSEEVYLLAKMIAKEKGLKIIEVRPYVDMRKKKNVLQTTSPEEFLGYFKYASYVVTTSFHGTAFSIKFQKEFVTLKLESEIDDRTADLLKRVNLKERMVSKNELRIPSEKINYNLVNKKLENLVCDSKEFIKNSLNEN